MKETQQNKILQKLNEGSWICSTELIDLYSVDYRSQINKLRKKGYVILSEPCNGRCGRNHQGKMNMWHLATQVGGMVSHGSHNPVKAGSIPAPATNECCPKFRIFGTHADNCEKAIINIKQLCTPLPLQLKMAN